jgi:hypothetical protein
LVAALACGALAMCAMWVGFLLFLRGGEEKNKINLRSVDSFVQIEKTIKETLND